MKPTPAQAAFAGRLGHDFDNPALLVEALTHASLSSPARPDNQRLEFLGDRVLGLVIAEALLAQDAGASEGTLAPRYNALVRGGTCAEIGRALDIGPALAMGRSESASGGRRKAALIADAVEAVIAAVYLDGGYEAARALVLRLWGDRIAAAESTAPEPKTALQEWAQARGLPPPDYEELAREGPDHAPRFTVRARVGSGVEAVAEAKSKRAAQQRAAEKLLSELEGGTDD